MILVGKKLLAGVGIIAMLISLNVHGDAVKQSLSRVSIVVDGMMKSKSGATWMSWPNSVEAALLELAGVNGVDIDLATDKFTVSYDATKVHSDEMQASIVKLGYRPSVVSSAANLNTSVSPEQLPDLVSDALREAGERGQFVFIDFYAPWCGACKKLEETTLSDPGVKTLLSGYVVLKIDTDKYPAVGKYFNVVGLPTVLVMNSSGKELYRHAGPIDREPLTKDLRKLAMDWWPAWN